MQVWIVLSQVFMQTMRAICLPVFWIATVLLAIQLGFEIWQREGFLGRYKQVVYWLPAFLLQVMMRLLSVLLLAVLGGSIASILLLLTGVSVEINAIPYIWIAMLFLFCIQRRFICFAYVGGMLVLMQSIAGVSYFDGRQILMLVAILHFTESILVYCSGALQAYPVYLRNHGGTTICRTQLHMTWPLPLAMPVPVYHTETALIQYGCVAMPEWWPILGTAGQSTDMVILYYLMPLFAVIGYYDIAARGKEHIRIRQTAGMLLCYSIVLGLIVIFSCKFPILIGIAAVVSIAGHEIIARL